MMMNLSNYVLNDIPVQKNEIDDLAHFGYFKKLIINSHVHPDIIWKGILKFVYT